MSQEIDIFISLSVAILRRRRIVGKYKLTCRLVLLLSSESEFAALVISIAGRNICLDVLNVVNGWQKRVVVLFSFSAISSCT